LLTYLFRISAEKEQLVSEHRQALDTQESINAALKDQLMQAELRHARELKEAQAAAEAKLHESLKEYTNASAVLRTELEEETVARKAAQDRIATLNTDQAEYDRLVMQADALALSKSFSLSLSLTSLHLLPVCPYTGYFFLLFLSF
jgi:t-SNARE complex subunit (syntaxin)